MRSRSIKKHMEALREELAEALNDVLERHGVLYGGVAYVPFDKAAAALFPDIFGTRPEPDAANMVPGFTNDRLDRVLERARSGKELFAPGEREEAFEDRRGTAPKKKMIRSTRRKDCQVVIETHARAP
jgi:hypothetical protein